MFDETFVNVVSVVEGNAGRSQVVCGSKDVLACQLSDHRRGKAIYVSIITVLTLLHISCLFKNLHILLYVNIDVILLFLYDNEYLLYVRYFLIVCLIYKTLDLSSCELS